MGHEGLHVHLPRRQHGDGHGPASKQRYTWSGRKSNAPVSWSWRHLRVAVAENPSDVHFSCGGVDERKGDHLRAEAHDHHHAPRARRLRAEMEVSSLLPSYNARQLCHKLRHVRGGAPHRAKPHSQQQSSRQRSELMSIDVCHNLLSGSDSSRT